MIRTIALVDMDAFLASVEQALNPDLIGKPVIVGGLPGMRGVVICASYEARKLGVKFGLPLAEASRRLPKAIFLKGDIKIYRDYWAEVCDIFSSFTPYVEPVSMDEAYLDLTGSLSLFGSPEILFRQIKDTIKKRLNIRCSIGVGTSKLFAKIACGMAKSGKILSKDGITIIKLDEEQRVLDNLPVGKLPNIGYKTRKLLTELGVYTIRELKEVPQQILIELFGKRGNQWYDYARGIDKREVKVISLPKSISRETTFNADSVDRKFLKGTLYYLLERVCLELRRLSLQTRRIGVKIRYVDYQFTDCVATLPAYSNNEPEIFPIVEKLFSELYIRKVGIRHLGITATGILPAIMQYSFFDLQRNKNSSLNAGLDKVRRHFGYHAIFYGRTMPLSDKFREVIDGYELRTPSLSL